MKLFNSLAVVITVVLFITQPRVAWAGDLPETPGAGGALQNSAASLPMLINYGLGGSWINPQATSQGLVLEIIPGLNALTAYWFTFGPDGDTREWFIAVGDINGASVSLNIYRVEGGVFEQVTLTDEVLWGSGNLQFSSCTEARFDFDSPVSGISGGYDLLRITPDWLCLESLGPTNATFVTTTNNWLDARGTWVFDTCVNLGPNESHGREEFRFTETGLSFDIERYNASDCQGPSFIQTLSFDMERVDKSMATLGNESVIANRVLLVDQDTGQTVRQILYFDDRQGTPMMTHGVLEGPFDADGFPNTLPQIFAKPMMD